LKTAASTDEGGVMRVTRLFDSEAAVAVERLTTTMARHSRDDCLPAIDPFQPHRGDGFLQLTKQRSGIDMGPLRGIYRGICDREEARLDFTVVGSGHGMVSSAALRQC
jgi:hypothetical protein